MRVQQPGQHSNEAQLILARDRILTLFINNLVQKFLWILSVRGVTVFLHQ